MALQKEFEVDNTGNKGNYIKIINFTFDVKPDGGFNFVLACGLYKDKASRDNGKNPASNINVEIGSDMIVNNLLETLYTEMKKLPELKGALDV